MITGIDHIDIAVEDPDATARHLIALGFKEIRCTSGSRGSIELRFPGGDHQPFLELTPSQRADGGRLPLGLRHIALHCENVDESFRELSDKGTAFDNPPRVIADTGRKLANVVDPGGISLQIVS